MNLNEFNLITFQGNVCLSRIPLIKSNNLDSSQQKSERLQVAIFHARNSRHAKTEESFK